MLILTRTSIEGTNAIRIGDDVTIYVTKIAGDKVRIGIEAPPSVQIVRPDAVNQHPRRDRETCRGEA